VEGVSQILVTPERYLWSLVHWLVNN
jgi:hypothetical protein